MKHKRRKGAATFWNGVAAFCLLAICLFADGLMAHGIILYVMVSIALISLAVFAINQADYWEAREKR